MASGKTEQECTDICMRQRNEDPNINGATLSNTGGHCYCEKNADAINSSGSYKTCYLAQFGNEESETNARGECGICLVI